MHGRPREYKNKLKDPQASEAHAKKVQAIKDATSLVLDFRKKRWYHSTALSASAKLLKVVPELYTLWNFRREALQDVFSGGGPAAQEATEVELALTMACLKENPKSYSTWHHRKWVINWGKADLNQELKLVNSALDQDERNFHAWHHRQWLVGLMGRSAEEELAYTEERILLNFSNYSAWHYRTLLLHQLYTQDVRTISFEDLMAATSLKEETKEDEGGETAKEQKQSDQERAPIKAPGSQVLSGFHLGAEPIPVHILDQEYDMVHQAFATDCEDQSPWMYYRWLLGNSLAHYRTAASRSPANQAAAKAVLAGVLAREVQRFREDHLSEGDSKWPLLMLALLRGAQADLGVWGEHPEEPQQVLTEVIDLYHRLIALDPMRKGYYQDQMEKIAPGVMVKGDQ